MRRSAARPSGPGVVEPGSRRPAVSVVVPFRGDRRDARALERRLAELELAPGDEIIVADNSDGAVAASALLGDRRPDAERAAALTGGQVVARPRVVAAAGERSSYHARNTGAAEAGREWILFLDADCVPSPGLLDAYFASPVPAACGLLAGAINGVAEQQSLLARYTRDRRLYDGERGFGSEGGAAPTGNLLVRRAAFVALGGFAEGIRSAGDFDFCWRAQAAGWRLLRRPQAAVAHAHRDEWIPFVAMLARYGSGASWLNARYPGAAPRWPLIPGLVGSAREIVGHAVRGRLEQAAFRAIDAVGLAAHNFGYRLPNELDRGLRSAVATRGR